MSAPLRSINLDKLERDIADEVPGFLAAPPRRPQPGPEHYAPPAVKEPQAATSTDVSLINRAAMEHLEALVAAWLGERDHLKREIAECIEAADNVRRICTALQGTLSLGVETIAVDQTTPPAE